MLRRGLVPAATLAALAAASLTPLAITQAAAATANPSPSSGARENATRLGFTLSGTASLSVDVATGNALISDQLLTLPGVNSSVSVAAAFNSAAVGTAMPSSMGGNGWVVTGFDQRLVANADGSVTYYGPAGLSGVFTPNAAAAGTYTQPSEFQADLKTASGGGWTMTMHQSQNVLTFNASGVLQSVKDRNGNTTTFNLDPYSHPQTIVTPRGAGAGQYATSSTTATLSTSGGRITKIAEAAAGLTRSVTVGYDSSNRVHAVTDAVGGVTTFGYGNGTATSPANQIVSVTNPGGEQTSLTYSGAKVTQVSQTNTATGSPGTSVTRLVYNAAAGATPAQTLVADPTTNQSQSVAAVAHTTYSLTTNGTMLVASATDADNHSQSATYNPTNNTTLTQQSAAGGTSTYTYGSNNNESLTEANSPGGAKGTASYTGSGQTQYEANTATNSAGDQLTLTYNGAGNQTSSAQSNVQASVGYNTLGQATSSQSPGAASGVQTTYTYDGTSHNLTTTTPVSGTNLGTRAYTWDGFGRLATATDGRGNTITYTYDNADRISKVDYSDTATHDVTYSYDAENRPTQRVDGSGTTTWTYDDLGRMTSVVNTAGGGTETYRYDLAGALASKNDSSGTTTYTYTAGHRVATMSYPQGSGGNLTTMFGYDSAGRRQDVWMQTSGGTNSSGTPNGWVAHEHTTYDTSGRVTAELGQQGPASSPTTVVNQTACYNTGSAAPTCGTGPTGDQAKIQFIVDNVSGETATFHYDSGTGTGQTGRLLSTAVTGGSNPRDYLYSYDARGNRLTAAVTHDTLLAGQTLTAGQQLTSLDGSAKFVMQADGNAVLYGTSGALFQTHTTGSGNTITMQTDGNLVVYNSGGTALWNSGTRGTGASNRLVAQGDKNLVMYTSTNAVAWQSNTAGTSGPVTGAGTALSFNNANQITSSGYTYDGAGNQTASPAGTAAFDTAGQQTSVARGGVTTSYTYAGTNSDELLSESTPSGHTYGLVYGKTDQSGLPEVEQVHYDANTAYVQHDPTTGAPLMLQTSSNVNCLYMVDITGNPVLLSTSFQTTSFAEQYDPYGSATQTSGGSNGGVSQNPYLFHFGLQDRITGNVKFGGRFYDPTTGTWTQQDTLNAPLAPGNANRYLYAGGDPVNAADATGDWSLSVSGCFAYLCAQVNVGTDDDGDLTGGGGIGVGTGDDGSGEGFGATASDDDITSGAYASASCSLGDVDAGVSTNDDGTDVDVQASTPSTGECSGYIGYNG